jgi:hypothetical protein
VSKLITFDQQFIRLTFEKSHSPLFPIDTRDYLQHFVHIFPFSFRSSFGLEKSHKVFWGVAFPGVAPIQTIEIRPFPALRCATIDTLAADVSTHEERPIVRVPFAMRV